MVNEANGVPAIEQELGIEITKEEKVVVYRQTIALLNKEKSGEALAYLQSRLHEGKVTGKILLMNMNQGGICGVQTEEVAKIRKGSELDELTDEAFVRDSLE